MKPIVNIFVTCEYVTLGQGERPTVVDVFNNIHFTQLPGSHHFTLFARLLAKPGSYPITIKAQREGADKGADIFSAEIRVNESGAHNILVREDFSFDHPGQYTFSIYSGDNLLGKTYLAISAGASSSKEAPSHETKIE